ncbi:hypothetical protein A8F94_05665 [Bacillus sp. FJAT-27225]|uniref:putative sporulation protein YtxC n=1 Tax=Bacillus sp. FJAT-27225 TaxID=1743144 RepID=UPI00080C2DCE|nr:putative sporulation protein YtxC [Bacillus sp. FJAT-27225]OCA91347.1 hypothetical protein A8F94_05665 [Bacillus sp. FJAT-27225]
MAEIHFRNILDAKTFHQLLQKHLKQRGIHTDVQLYEERPYIKLKIHAPEGEYLDTLKFTFNEFIWKVKWDEWFMEMIRDAYLFQDSAEIQHITDIMYSILDGERQDLALFMDLPFPGEQVRDSIEQVLSEDASLSFDSYAKFRLRAVFDYMSEIAALSIDEYKMEQEYQIFIESLRSFLSGRPPKIEEIHLLADGEVTFYDGNMLEVKKTELTKMIDRKLLINHPVYVDSVSIAPLLSIAPRRIVLYTDHHDSPLVRTIVNIFEERVLLQKREKLTIEDGQSG